MQKNLNPFGKMQSDTSRAGLEYDHYNVNTLMVSQILENPITHNCSFVIMGECSNDERITAFFDRRQKEWMEKNKDSCDIQLVEYNIKAA